MINLESEKTLAKSSITKNESYKKAKGEKITDTNGTMLLLVENCRDY